MSPVTDPQLTGWFDGFNDEIGDLCNFTFSTSNWPGLSAAGDQNWNGTILVLQQEWDNNAGACVSAGPQ
jgi:hypothetical protein